VNGESTDFAALAASTMAGASLGLPAARVGATAAVFLSARAMFQPPTSNRRSFDGAAYPCAEAAWSCIRAARTSARETSTSAPGAPACGQAPANLRPGCLNLRPGRPNFRRGGPNLRLGSSEHPPRHGNPHVTKALRHPGLSGRPWRRGTRCAGPRTSLALRRGRGGRLRGRSGSRPVHVGRNHRRR